MPIPSAGMPPFGPKPSIISKDSWSAVRHWSEIFKGAGGRAMVSGRDETLVVIRYWLLDIRYSLLVIGK
jgi:hypothetical protein